MPKTARRAPAALPKIDPAFAPLVAAFADDAQVSRKRMFGSSNVLSVNRKIFAMLTRGKLVVKLPRARVDAIVGDGKGEQFDPGHGRLMKEWVSVGAEAGDWVELAQEAYEFVRGVPVWQCRHQQSGKNLTSASASRWAATSPSGQASARAR
jgi:hypothetical protein